MSNAEKNKRIGEAGRQTRLKRKNQVCRVFKVKVNKSALKPAQKEALEMQFTEAKWLANEIIGSNDVFNYKAGKTVTHKDKDFNDVQSEFKFLGSQMKQSMQEEIKSNIKTLSTRKKKNLKVGKLKFRKEIKSINLPQHNITYKIVSKRKIKIQNVPKELRVHGLDQIMTKRGNLKYEVANAKLLNTPTGYYVAITCYENKTENKVKETNKKEEVGLDFGCSTTLTLSDGVKYNVSVRESDRLKRLQRKFSKQKKGSKRRNKTLHQVNIEYQKLSNKKNDMANKIVNEIARNYGDIYMQDENLEGWKKNYGMRKTVQHSILGRLKAKLVPKAKVVLSKWTPTTKYCPNCYNLNEAITLSDRIFTCPTCDYSEDRDVHAGKNMLFFGKNLSLFDKHKIGLGRSKSTLAETSLSEVVETRRSSNRKNLKGVKAPEDATSLA
jgi:putative transposase